MENNPFSAVNTNSSAVEINKVLKNTYMLLSMTLMFSALMASISVMMEVPRIAAIGCSLGAFGMLFVMNKFVDSSKGIVFAFAFTGLLGFSLGPMLSHYLAIPGGSALIAQALGGTGIIFLALSGYALTSKKDFSFMGGFLVVGLIVALIAAIANIFFQIPALSLAISSAIIFIMSGFILFDTSRIIHGGETNYIRATISLYLNIHNIFVHLLSILGVMGDD